MVRKKSEALREVAESDLLLFTSALGQRDRKMPDQRKEIAEELGRLVEDGNSLYLSVEIRNWENAEERKKLEKQLEEQEDIARGKVKSKSRKGRSHRYQ